MTSQAGTRATTLERYRSTMLAFRQSIFSRPDCGARTPWQRVSSSKVGWQTWVMSLESVRALEAFRARQARDATALDREGQTFVLMNELWHLDGSISIEIMFEDGSWMLATQTDLDFTRVRPACRDK